MTDSVRQSLRKWLKGAPVIIAGFGLIGVYLLVLAGPIVLAAALAKSLAPPQSWHVLFAFIGLSIIFSAISVGIGNAIGLFDFENATGRVPRIRR